MLRTFLFVLSSLCFLSFQAKAGIYPVTTLGLTYQPDTLHIALGDTVQFNLGNNHNAVEVSQATWLANGTSSNGGFNIPFGGGQWIPASTDTFYYVCTPHAGLGMKAIVVVHPQGFAQISSINNLQPCAGDTILGIVNVNGFFHPGNQFQIYLSDGSGSFANPTLIGTLNGNSSGVFQGIIPPGTPFGNGYLLALASTAPASPLTQIGGVLIIQAGPTVSISGNHAACFGDTITLTANGAINYWWSNGASGPSVQITQSDTIVLTGNSGGGCASTDTLAVSFAPLPAVGLSAADSVFCINDNPEALNGLPIGGNYSGDQIFGFINPSILNPGIYAAIYTYTDNQGCTNADTFAYTVHGLPSVGFFLQMDTLCLLGANMPLNGTSTPPGGQFSGQGVSNNSFSPIQAGLGTWPITYSFTDFNGCTGTAMDTIEVINCAMGIPLENQQSFAMYPNPASEVVYMSSLGDWVLYDAQGREVRQSKGQRMDLVGLETGVYHMSNGQSNRILVITKY